MTFTETLYIEGAAGYDRMFARITQASIPVHLDAARIAAGHSILDVATGTGAAARTARDRAGSDGEVIAGDISATMLEVARQKMGRLPHYSLSRPIRRSIITACKLAGSLNDFAS